MKTEPIDKRIKASLDKERLIKQAKIEIEAIRNSFHDAYIGVERVLAIQYLLDQVGGDSGILAEINEMSDDLYAYQKILDDPGEEGYDDLLQCMFFDRVRIDFTQEATEQEFTKREAFPIQK